MTAGRTGLLSQRELADTDSRQVGDDHHRLRQQTHAADQLFGPTTLYRTEKSEFDSTRFIFWKTDDQPGGVPSWDDPGIQAEVSVRWHLVQARKLALDAAEKLKAEAAASTGKSLKELIKNDKSVEYQKPSPFTWQTVLLGQARLSEVGDLTHIGEDFMQQVFNLGPGQVMVTTNVPKSEVYLVRMIDATPMSELWKQYVADDTSRDYLYALYGKIGSEAYSAWRKQILDDAGFKRETPAQPSNAPVPEPDGVPPPEDF